MTTAEDLRLQREQHDRAHRRANREHARAVITGALIGQAGPIEEDAPGHWLFPDHLTTSVVALLDMCGLLGDPEDDGIPVVLPHAFHQPAAKLSAPAAGSYR